MPLQKPLPGTASQKRNSWVRSSGPHGVRGELKCGISRNKKYLNRKVRRRNKITLQHADYKRICRSVEMVKFT